MRGIGVIVWLRTGIKLASTKMIIHTCFHPQVILFFTLLDFKRSSYRDYIFPVYWEVLGWCITIISVIMVPLVATIKLCTSHPRATFREVSIMTLCCIMMSWSITCQFIFLNYFIFFCAFSVCEFWPLQTLLGVLPVNWRRDSKRLKRRKWLRKWTEIQLFKYNSRNLTLKRISLPISPCSIWNHFVNHWNPGYRQLP